MQYLENCLEEGKKTKIVLELLGGDNLKTIKE